MTSSVDWAVELAHTWPLLETDGPTRISSAPLPIPAGRGNVRIGVDGGDGRHLLVPVGDEDVRTDGVEGALTVLLRTYTFQGTPLRYVDVVCTRPDLVHAFDNVLVDILGQIEHTPTPAGTTVEAVSRWRALLATRRSEKLTLTAQMSLFAELTVLDLVTAGAELPARWWRGPRREPHDIVTPDRAIEVKAVGATSSTVTIHGVDQLDPPDRPLALVVAEVSEEPGGRTLPELVDAILSRVNDRGEALWLLTAAGYERGESERYQERFVVTGIAHVEVSEALPRIVSSSFGPGGVPVGVTKVEYRLAMDVLEPLLTRGEKALRVWAVGS
ncbi:PD-(D/E)XK motif protein [Pseudonocardia sp. CA-142604]|uniref:PD-(D/E)XK motif protein n=1 Tax=Pseudonocardia sp. CA-142604 TaxID=3240024 RepID=UPI003D928245